MRVAILGHNLRFAGGLSVGRNTVASLRQIADQHEYFFTLPAGVGYEAIELPTRSSVRYFRRASGLRGALGQIWFDMVGLERVVRAWRPDVIWGLGNFGLKRPGCPQAIVCQDSHFVYDPRQQRRQVWSNGPDMHIAFWRLTRSLPATRLVFCQTQTMATRFRERFTFRGEMAVMPNAVSRFGLNGIPTRPAVFDRLAGKFVLLALTRYYTHKNLEVLAEMFHVHAARLRDVIVLLTFEATQGYGADKFAAKIENPAIRDFFINVGPVPQRELAGYFRHSAALIQPTVLESFSTTYLEAMQFETPILTSDLDFAREVCGDAALYFDPWDVDSVLAAVERLRESPELGREQVRRGKERMQSYFRSWDEIVSAAMGRLEQFSARKGG